MILELIFKIVHMLTVSYPLLSVPFQREQLAKLRLKLQRGLETIRLVGNHGIKPTLLIHLAKTFEERVCTYVVSLVLHM